MNVFKISFSITTLLLLTSCGVLFTSCSKDDDTTPKTTYGIFKVINDNTVEMNGVIEGSALSDFNALIAAYPNINKINMNDVPGADDDVNLQLAPLVYQNNIATHIIENGIIASGGVDFFLAGTTRTKASNAKIGVHSWDGGGQQATDFPVGHANHLPYIEYYVSVGFSQQLAEDFYYFTINAAPASGIHWMTDAEIEQYNILKP